MVGPPHKDSRIQSIVYPKQVPCKQIVNFSNIGKEAGKKRRKQKTPDWEGGRKKGP
jgi:hypothetical protein